VSKLDDIAKVAGVSRHTVARILNGKRQERWPSKQEQGDRIRRLAEEMGYRPNASARALVLGKFNCVGLVLSTDSNRSPITHGMLGAVDEALSEKNLHLAVARLSDSSLQDTSYVPKILREWLCDGLIINYRAAVPPKIKKLLSDFNIPAVWMNSDLEKDAVYADEIGASVAATRRLLDLGHKRIAYVDHSYYRARRSGTRHYSNEERKGGYTSAMTDAGLEPIFMLDDEKKYGGFRQRVEEMLKGKGRPTAVVSGSPMSMRVVTEIAAGLGLTVPQDLSYVTFSAGGIDPSLWDDSAVIYPEKDLCREAVKMVMRKIAHPQMEISSVKVPYEVREGGTAVPCPG